MLSGTGQLAKCFDPLHDDARFRQEAEEVGQAALDGVEVVARGLEVGLAPFVGVRKVELRVLADEREELLQRAVKPDLVLDRFHLGLDTRDLAQA